MTNDQCRNNVGARMSDDCDVGVAWFGIRHSDFFRHSSFVIRHSLRSLGVLLAFACLAGLVAGSPAQRQLDWPMFRGNSQLTGVATSPLPEKLSLLWTYQAEGK